MKYYEFGRFSKYVVLDILEFTKNCIHFCNLGTITINFVKLINF